MKTLALIAASLPALAGASLAIDSVVVFNEVHYHPAGDDTTLEYVELYNQLAADVDMSNWRMQGDVDFDFPEGTVLGGREYLVIAKDPAALQVATGYSGALGPFEGALSNSGGRVRLYNNNRSFRTLPQGGGGPSLPADKLWSVDLQGDGAGGAFGQLSPPNAMSGTEGNADLGNVWNHFSIPGHNGTVTDPTMALVDSAGAASSVSFAVDGRVTGWSQGGSALISDYLFVNAGNSDSDINWTISGLTPGTSYSLYAYGGISRDILLTVDKDGDGSLAGETGTVAAGAGALIEDITASATGTIFGRAQNGSVSEGNWGGFQLFEQTGGNGGGGGPPVGAPSTDLEARRIMDEIDYEDVYPWPVGPDGSGFALAKRDPASATQQPENWTHSGSPDGSPGSANTFSTVPALGFNEVAGSADGEFWLELFNHGDSPIQLDGIVVASSNPLHADYTFAPNLIGPEFATFFNSQLLGYVPEDNNRLFLYTAGKSALIDVVRVDDRAQSRLPDGDGPWYFSSAPTYGTPNGQVPTSVVLEDSVVINEIFYHAYPQRASAGTEPGLIDVEVLDYDDVWRYNLDAGAAGLAANWASSAHVADDVSWSQGPGLLGQETSALGEPIRTPVTLSSKVPYYFETEFDYSDPETVVEMEIDHYVDDGAVFYLNGVEIGRFNMPAGAFSATSLASPGVSNASLNTLIVDSPAVLQGSNRLSVEVHQSSSGSSDVVFGTRVTLRKSDGSGTPAGPYAERDEEWVELFNRGPAAVDLTGWKLGGGIGYDFPAATSIPAGGYLVIDRDAYSGKLGNGGDRVVLEDSNGNPADEVRYYDGGRWHGAADGGGSSLELIDPDSDNRVAGAWAASDESSRSSWQTYSYEAVAVNDGIGHNVYHEFLLGLLDAGELLLDDVSVVEDGSIEFIQNGDFESDPVGSTADRWRAVGTHGSHGRTVVVNDPDQPGNRCLHVVSSGPTEDKHNKLETTFANNERVVAGRSYRITFRAKWLSGSNQVNTRLYFNYVQRTTNLAVPNTWGTPGAPNSVAVANAGPTLSGLAHSPVVPNASQSVSVSIDAGDPDGMGAVTLFYSVNGGSFSTRTMSPGADGRYAGTVPGQSASRIVRFYVRARDSSGAESFYPAAAAEGGAFYKVQDGLADNSGLRHNFRIVMAESDRAFLFNTTNRLSNDRFPVTVIEDEAVAYHDVGLRLKASGFGRFNSGHYGFNIRFHPDQLFRGVHETISIERSPNLKEILAKHLMNRAGGGYWSFYDDVAYIIPPTTGDRGVGLLSMARHTETFWEGLFPDEDTSGTLFNHELLYNPNGTTGGPEGLKIGNPYNHTGGRYDLVDRGDDKEPYRWGFQIRSARGRDDYSQMVAVNQAMGNLSGSALRAALDPIIDVDQWMRTFAMMSLNGTDDVFSRIWEHNFRYYVRPTDNRVIILQWDLDRSFQLGAGDSVTPTRNTVTKLFSIPQYRRLFDGHLDDLIKTTFNSTYTTPWAAHFTQLTGDGLNGLPGYISGRASTATNSLPAALTFEITTDGGNDFSEADSVVDIAGDGWIDVFDIEVNGVEMEVSWTDANSWQVTVPLRIGANALLFRAFNNRGTEVGSDAITVTNTSAIDIADATNTVISELHYHPADPTLGELAAGFLDPDLFEFVEVLNIGNTDVDYTGVSFTDGVTYGFPVGTVLAPGERVVVVADVDAFEARYGVGAATIVGVYTGNFRNSGERVRLDAADDSPIADFTYSDDSPWPESADGPGYSLVFAGADPIDPLDWRPSAALGGNPGSTDRIPFAGGPADLIPYALAGDPTATIVGDTFLFTFPQRLGADDASIVVEFSTDLGSWTDAMAGDLVSRSNLGDGTALQTYALPLAPGGDQRQFGRVRVIGP